MTITLRTEQLQEAGQQWTEERGGADIKGQSGQNGGGVGSCSGFAKQWLNITKYSINSIHS